MKKKCLYVKKFSEIENLQEEKEIRYYICEEFINNISKYGVLLFEISRDSKSEDGMYNLTNNRNEVINMLKLLYENSIGILGFKDIIKDMMWKIS